MADEQQTAEKAAKLLAEAEKARAEAAKAEAEAEKARYEAAQARLALEREEFKRRKELADDEHHHVYRFTSSVSEQTVRACIGQLETWSRLDPGCEITLVFTSPGGSVIDGMALFDYLTDLRERGHRLVTAARGYAASMAGILLQAGDERVIGPQSWLLIHEASFGALGSYGEVEDMVEWVKAIQERILDIFAARSQASDPTTATHKLTKAQIRRRWHRKNWWLSSDQALRHGFVDAIR